MRWHVYAAALRALRIGACVLVGGTWRIASARLADENPRFSGQNLARCVLHGTRRKTGSVRGT